MGRTRAIREQLEAEASRLRDGSGMVVLPSVNPFDACVVIEFLVDLNLHDCCMVAWNPVEDPPGGWEILIANVKNAPPTPDHKITNPVTGTEYKIRERGSKGLAQGLRGKWKK